MTEQLKKAPGEKRPKSYPLSLLACLILILGVSVYSRGMLFKFQESEKDNVIRRMVLTARLAVDLTSAEELEKFQAKEDIERADYQALKKKLVNLALEAGVMYAYYFRIKDRQVHYIVDNDFDPKTRVGLETAPVDAAVEKGHEIALSGRISTEGAVHYSMGWPDMMSVYAPIFDQEGRVVAITGIDEPDLEMKITSRKATAALALQIFAVLGIIYYGYHAHKCHREEVKQVRNADRSKSLFLARMSHEIRTPMNAIVGLSELLTRQSENFPTQTLNYIRNIKRAGGNLLSIINDILDFSKIESGNFEILPDSYCLSALIDDILNIIKARLLEKPVRLTIFLDGSLPDRLYGDAARVRQILLNLLSNAVKYTREGSIALEIVPIHRAEDDLTLSIKVSDTGVGIKLEDLGRLFGDFERLDLAENKNIEGTGLGLAIARNLCQLMGGDIQVTSEYGQGSVFTVILPQKIDNPTPVALVEKASEKAVLVFERRAIYAKSMIATLDNLNVRHCLVNSYPSFYEALEKFDLTHMIMPVSVYIGLQNSLKERDISAPVGLTTEDIHPFGLDNARYLFTPIYSRPLAAFLNNVPDQPEKLERGQMGANFTAPRARVLIVDDLPTNLMVAEGLFFPYGMRLDFSRGGEEAVRLAQHNDYDLIFMDHMMPGMDGVEAARAIRAIGEKQSKTPIVAMTANAVSGMREMFLGLGMDDFLTKPIETNLLNSILLRWIPLEKQEKIQPDRGKEPIASPGQAAPKIEGLDVALGLSRANGRMEAYLTTLEYFRKDALIALSNLNASLEAKEYKDFLVHIHALKSSAGVTGATNLAARAAALEAAAIAGAEGFIAGNIASFRQDLIQLVDGLTKYFEDIQRERAIQDQLADEEVKTVLRELKEVFPSLDNDQIEDTLRGLVGKNISEDLRAGVEELTRDFLENGSSNLAMALDRLLSPNQSR
ncbi:MAG: response regulator [Deltaproteobacteria bacterium]|jgi:signal transduction histidine kinase/CheY-like chemotaxis protein/HPt (histidine-containing phosphotransfer) domain-containing protein|nr:response regulator [Deltaproteobacteria bacterium]